MAKNNKLNGLLKIVPLVMVVMGFLGIFATMAIAHYRLGQLEKKNERYKDLPIHVEYMRKEINALTVQRQKDQDELMKHMLIIVEALQSE